MSKQYFYLRVSTQTRGENALKQREQTFERQKSILEMAGYTLTADNTFAERISGKTRNDEREQFERLLSVVAEGDWVIFSETSRFSRSYINGMEMLDTLIFDKKVNVRFVSNGIDLCANGKFNPYTWYTISQMLLADELQRRIISYNTTNGLQAKKQQGVRLGHPVKYTPEQDAQALALVEKGYTYSQVAEMTGINRNRVCKVVAESKKLAAD